MSKFYEALVQFEYEINQYAEGPAIQEITLKHDIFEKVRFVIRKELSYSGHVDASGNAFGFHELGGTKGYFTCRGIKFIKGERS